ncbi:hypothetical protein ACJMK2_007809 [Sinanodonta woodiana]|uniref:Uncharacterized protein n=1 Tax=Sinanodonta woodiana TaxID=1069815 RepID=A0ABD3VM48_SINWO
MRTRLLILVFASVANAMTTPYAPTGPIDNVGMTGRTAGLFPAGGFNSLATRNQMTGEGSSGATASHVDPNPMAQMLSSLFSLGGSATGGGSGTGGGSATGGGSGGSGSVGGLGSLSGGGHADIDPMSQMFPSMFNLGGTGTGGSSNLGGLGSLFGGGGNSGGFGGLFGGAANSGGFGGLFGGAANSGGFGGLFGGGGNSLQNMALLGTGTDQLLNLAGMDCMMNSAAPSTAMDPACMMLMMQQMTTGI